MGGYAKQGAKEEYRKQLMEEAEKYLPKRKPTVNIYGEIGDAIKQNPELAEVPFIDFIKAMQEKGRGALKEAAARLIAQGAQPERVRKLTVEVGMKGEEIEMSGKKYVRRTAGTYNPGKGKIDVYYHSFDLTSADRSSTMAHELVHFIIDRSAFGKYMNSLAIREVRSEALKDKAMKKVVDLELKKDDAWNSYMRTKGPKKEEAEKKLEKLKKDSHAKSANWQKINSKYQTVLGKIEETSAINEAVAHAVASSLKGQALSQAELKRKDETYGFAISKFYPDMMKLIEKAGVKGTIEAVRMINPGKANRDPKAGYYKNFSQIKEKLLAKA